MRKSFLKPRSTALNPTTHTVMPLPVPAENDSLQPSVEVVALQFDRPIAHWRASDNTPHYLDTHLSDVSVLCSVFAGKLGLHRAGKLIGLLHDLGKYSQEFRSYIGSALGLVSSCVEFPQSPFDRPKSDNLYSHATSCPC